MPEGILAGLVDGHRQLDRMGLVQQGQLTGQSTAVLIIGPILGGLEMNLAMAAGVEKIIAFQMTVTPVVVGKNAVGGDGDLATDQFIGRLVVDELPFAFQEFSELAGIADMIDQESDREVVRINRVFVRLGQGRGAEQQG